MINIEYYFKQSKSIYKTQKENRIEKLLFSNDIDLVKRVLITHPDINLNFINDEGKNSFVWC